MRRLPLAAADGTTKGVVTFSPNDFNCTDGLCSLDYANGGAASSTTKGFLTNTDWVRFDAKQEPLGFTPENVANKKSVAVLGTSNQFYPTQGAVKEYVDNGVKAMTNTALTPRPCVGLCRDDHRSMRTT